MSLRITLLSICALTAAVAPAFVGMSCGRRADDETASHAAAENRALVAASVSRASDGRPPAVAGSNTAPATPPARADTIPGLIYLPPLPEDFPGAARVKASQRDFLSSLSRWSPQKAAELKPKLALYQERRFQWDGYPVRVTGPVPDVKGMWTRAESDAWWVKPRRELDAALADRSQLTKEAAAEWAAWEARGWRNYPLRLLSSENQSASLAEAPPQESGPRIFRAACVARVGHLRDEMEYLYDREHIANANVYAALESKVDGFKEEARRLACILRDEEYRGKFYGEKFEIIQRLAQDEWQKWEAKNWEGFPMDGSFVVPGAEHEEAARRRAESEGKPKPKTGD